MIDPASEQVTCEVAEGDREDIDRAAKAAIANVRVFEVFLLMMFKTSAFEQ